MTDVVGPEEFLEESALLARWDAHAFILNRDDDVIALLAHADLDFLVARRIFERVAEEILEHNTLRTRDLLQTELEIKLGELLEKWHMASLEKISQSDFRKIMDSYFGLLSHCNAYNLKNKIRHQIYSFMDDVFYWRKKV